MQTLRRSVLTGVALAVLLTLKIAAPAEASGVTIIGSGTSPCSSWTEGRSHQSGDVPNVRVMAQLSWVQGFITALDTDMVRAGGPSITPTAMVPALLTAIDGYCSAHPGDNIATAAIKVATELLTKVMGR